jgi:WD40 repeat protein
MLVLMKSDRPADSSRDSAPDLPVFSGQRGLVKRLGDGCITDLVCCDAAGCIAVGTSHGVQLRDAATLDVITTLDGHTLPVSCLCVSKGGTQIASASYDGRIQFWNLDRREAEATLGAVNLQVLCVSCSDQAVAAGIWEEAKGWKVVLWSANSHEQMRQLRIPVTPVSMAFSSDSSLLAVGMTSMLVVYETSSGKRVYEKPGGPFSSVCFSPDGRFLFGARAGLELTDLTRRCEFDVPKETSGAVVLGVSPSGRDVYTGHLDGRVDVWSLDYIRPSPASASRDIVPVLSREASSGVAGIPVVGLALSHGGSRLIAASSCSLKALDSKDGSVLQKRSDAFSPRSACPGVAFSDSLILVRSPTIEEYRLRERTDERLFIAIPVDASSAQIADEAAPSGPSVKHVWWKTLLEDAPDRVFQGSGTVYGIAADPSGRYLAYIDLETKTTHLVDAQSGEETVVDGLAKPAFSHDGALFASGIGRELCIRDTEGAVAVKHLAGPIGDNVRVITFSPDLRFVAGGFESGSVCIWDLASQKRLKKLPAVSDHVYSLAFAHSRPLLAVGSQEIVVWNTGTWRRQARIDTPKGTSLAVAFCQYSDFLFCGRGNNILVWDLENDRQVCVIQGHKEPILSLAFLGGGGTFATASVDGVVCVWDTSLTLWDATAGKIEGGLV